MGPREDRSAGPELSFLGSTVIEFPAEQAGPQDGKSANVEQSATDLSTLVFPEVVSRRREPEPRWAQPPPSPPGKLAQVRVPLLKFLAFLQLPALSIALPTVL